MPLISNEAEYAAFISYAHADERAARRLHEALEAYDLPDGILVNGRESFSPIFRDVTELTAAHSLSEKIKQALQRSNYLIVLCSPSSKDSHWVNEEIRLFRELHGDRAILSAIIEGTPSTSFPPALLEGGHEPLAANLKQGRDSFRFGVHQLAASILDVGLDTLVQRAQRKRRFRARLMTAAASGLAIVMGGLWFNAHTAQQAAEKSRDDAERLVEYMVSDLKSELYSLQRLDILDGLGEEIVTYYEGLDPSGLPDERLVRLITAIQSLSEVAIEEKKYDRAVRYLRDSSSLVEILEDRNRDTDDSLFYRAQNEYWEGLVLRRQNKFAEAMPYWEAYNAISQRLYAREPDNTQWAMEAGWGSHNLSVLHRMTDDIETSMQYTLRANETFGKAFEKDPNDLTLATEFANILGVTATNFDGDGQLEKAIEYQKMAVEILEKARATSDIDFKAEHYYSIAKHKLFNYEKRPKCDNPEFDAIIQISRKVYENEPSNPDFQEQHLRQEFGQLFECLRTRPESVSEEELDWHLRLAGQYKQSWEDYYRERLEKLRTHGPELE